MLTPVQKILDFVDDDTVIVVVFKADSTRLIAEGLSYAVATNTLEVLVDGDA